MKKIMLWVFAVAVVGELAAVSVDGAAHLQLVCKPLLMLSLGAYYVVAAREGRSSLVIAAIGLSLLGDVMLMFEKDNAVFFMLGLGSFLLAHVTYIYAYRQHQGEAADAELAGVQKIRFALPVILGGTGLVVVLYPRLGDLQIPVLLYAIVLVLMVLQALLRFGRTPAESFWRVFLGALLFMISDSLLAINKFLDPLPNAGLWIMATYCAAQLSIVTGLLKHRD